MDEIEFYAAQQRRVYDDNATNRENAEALVGAGYDKIAVQASNQAQFAMNEYFRRRPYGQVIDTNMPILDFGCGVGRMMEAFAKLGFASIDGVDISERMLSFARESPHLANSRFWLTNGHDCGEAPQEHYELAYSFITMQHICMRQTRIDIMRSMHRCLRPGGVVLLEFQCFPGVTAHRVPRNHATWSMNMTAEDTNSKADVWITPDQLGHVYDDLRLWFRDIQFQELDSGENYFAYAPDSIYQYPGTRFLLVASKGAGLADKYFNG